MRLLTASTGVSDLSSPTNMESNVYTVRIKNTQYQFTVGADETVLSAALRQGVESPWGCGSGVCGVCMGDILEGKLEYPSPPMALFEGDEASGKGLLCVGLPRSDLLLYIPEMSD